MFAACVTAAWSSATELERARAVWTRRFSEPPATPQERARQVR